MKGFNIKFFICLATALFSLVGCNNASKEPKNDDHVVVPPAPYPGEKEEEKEKPETKGSKWEYIQKTKEGRSIFSLIFTSEKEGAITVFYELDGKPTEKEEQTFVYIEKETKEKDQTHLMITYKDGMTDEGVIDWVAKILTLKGGNESDLVFHLIK